MSDQLLSERYVIKQQLGKHAGRQTLLARDLDTNELVVVKLLTFSYDFEWDDFKLFERESATLKELNHPAIPHYRNFLELDLPKGKGFALVQTYVEGCSLEAHIKAGRLFDEPEVKQLAKALLEIFIYLHSRHPPVIHRDIKPSNIVLTDRSGNSVGQVYLVDFGSVQTLAAIEGGTITVVGTYGYMAPEQFGGRATPASDLYSLGATLIYLVTGTHPADLPQKQLQIQFPVAHLSPAFADWLKWMTEPSIEQRLPNAQAALQALEQGQMRQNDSDSQLERRPKNSKVLLTKKADVLEIFIPPGTNTLTSKEKSSIVVTLISLLAILLCINGLNFALKYYEWKELCPASLCSSPPTLSGGLLSMSIMIIILAIIHPIQVWLHRSRKQIWLRIDKHHILLTEGYKGFGHNFSKIMRRQNIDKLEYVHYSTISIRAGEQRLDLKIAGLLSKSELEWLAHEISNWVRLPIT